MIVPDINLLLYASDVFNPITGVASRGLPRSKRD